MRVQVEREMERAVGSTETKADAERRKEIALANIREREDAKQGGRVVEREPTARAWFAVCRAARDRMLAIPARVEVPMGLTTAQKDILMLEIRAVLELLTKEVPGVGDPLPDAPNP